MKQVPSVARPLGAYGVAPLRLQRRARMDAGVLVSVADLALRRRADAGVLVSVADLVLRRGARVAAHRALIG